MRALSILPCVALLGCRALFGIDDPVLAADAAATTDAVLCGDTDWDNDGRADGCDPCPMYAEPIKDVDKDRDGIGDGCDPRPDAGGDLRLLWNGFGDPSSIAMWTPSGGTWTVTDGKLVQSDEGATGRLALPGTLSNVYLATEIDVIARGLAPQPGMCAYVGAAFKCCDVNEDQGPPVSLMAWSSGAKMVLPWSGSLAIGQRLELTERATNVEHTCRATQVTGAAEVTLQYDATPGLIALHVRQIAVAYRYLFVVQMPP